MANSWSMDRHEQPLCHTNASDLGAFVAGFQ
jgi:hypothetical protein